MAALVPFLFIICIATVKSISYDTIDPEVANAYFSYMRSLDRAYVSPERTLDCTACSKDPCMQQNSFSYGAHLFLRPGSYFEKGNRISLFFQARKSSARQIDNGIDDDAQPRVYCFRNGMKIKLSTLKPFTGVLYVKGMSGNPLCNRNFSGESTTPSLAIAYEDCIHQRERLAKPPGMTFMVTIVAQFHPFFTTSIDRAFIVTCTYREAINTVTNRQILQGHVGGGGPGGGPGGDSDTIPTTKLSHTPVLPLCKYTIHRGSVSGPIITYARVGEKTFHKWQCYPSSDGEFHGLLVHSCVARAGNGIQIKLLDKKGCTLDPFAMGTPKYALNLTMAYVEVHAFKFADDLQISFSCSISLCLRMNNRCQGITPPNCTAPHPHGPGSQGGGGYPRPGGGQPGSGQSGGFPRPGGGQSGGYPRPGGGQPGGGQSGGYPRPGGGQPGGGQSGGYPRPGGGQPGGGQSGGYPHPGGGQPGGGQSGGYPRPGGGQPGGGQSGGYPRPGGGQPGGGQSGGYPRPGGGPQGPFPSIALPPPPPPPSLGGGYGSPGGGVGPRPPAPVPPPGHSGGPGSGPSIYFPPGYSSGRPQTGTGSAYSTGGGIRPPAPPPISGSYAVLSDSVVEDYPDTAQNKRSPKETSNKQEKDPVNLEETFQDSVSFQGILNPVNLTKPATAETSEDQSDQGSSPQVETEGFGYVSFGTELSAPSLSLIDLPNLPPLPPEEIEFLKGIQRDARELGRSVSHHRISGIPEENPDDLDAISDASMDVAAEDFIVFDRKAEIPEPLTAKDEPDYSSEYSELTESACEPKPSSDYCISRIVFVQVVIGVSLCFASLFATAAMLWIRNRRKRRKDSDSPVLTYHYDNISCNGDSTLSRPGLPTTNEPDFHL